MKKLILSTAIMAALGAGVSTSASAALMSNAKLDFDPGVVTYVGSSNSIAVVKSGSYFAMGANLPAKRTALVENNGLLLGTVQAASGSHSGAPDGTESPGIDAPWYFTSNTGMHFTSTPTNVLSATGNTASIDFSGWGVTWNGIAGIPMGAGASNGIASVVCTVDCATGDTYALDYLATVPSGDPSGFGGVDYFLHLEGTVAAPSAVPVPAAVWLFGSGLLGLVGVARRKKVA